MERVLDAQETAYRIFFDAALREVLLTPGQDPSDLRLPNAVARARARELLEDPSLAGIVVPRDLKQAPPPAAPRRYTLRDDPLSRKLVSDDATGSAPDHPRGRGSTPRPGGHGRGVPGARARRWRWGHAPRALDATVLTPWTVAPASSFGSLFPLVGLVMGLVVFVGLGSLARGARGGLRRRRREHPDRACSCFVGWPMNLILVAPGDLRGLDHGLLAAPRLALPGSASPGDDAEAARPVLHAAEATFARACSRR
ncbi:MAG: hypothetical protein R3F62_05370 [Planctomycetota bacterium]